MLSSYGYELRKREKETERKEKREKERERRVEREVIKHKLHKLDSTLKS